MGDKGIDGKFQFCFGGFLFLIHRIILSLAAFLRHKDGQAVFPAQPVADVAYSVIGALVGNILVVVYKVYRTKNDVVMDMPFIYVSGKDVFILPLCYRVGKLFSDFMGFLIIDFPRLKRLYQMVCEEEIPEIPCDVARMRQVFLNVLDNAAKHGGDGKRITASISLENGQIVVRIRDYGPGIPEEELPHVKMKFYKGSSKARGSGIGLAVCEEIVTMHGGTITLENAEGGGTLVTISIPTGEE